MKTILAVMAYKTANGKSVSRTYLELFQNYDDVLEVVSYWIETFDPKNMEAKDKLFQIALDLIRGCGKPVYDIALKDKEYNIRIKIEEL